MNAVTLIQSAPYSEFKYWFVAVGKDKYDVYSVLTKVREMTSVSESTILSVETNSVIKADFCLWRARPEYILGRNLEYFENMPMNDMYDMYLVGAYMTRIFEAIRDNPDVYVDKVEACIKWLHSTDFYEAPASTRFHDPVPGGLLKHTIDVILEITDLCELPKFQSVPLHSAVLVACTHDWCKIGLYESFMRNVKNEETGKWEKVPSYRHREVSLTSFGHGVSSMFLAQKFFKLSVEEALAIRWHMSSWRCVTSETSELQQSNEMYPLVHMIQFADQLSLTTY